MTYQFEAKKLYQKINETCPKCHESFSNKEEKRMIVSYGLCSRCLYERDTGKKLPPRPSFVCECGKEFVSLKNLDRHCDLKNHKPVGGFKAYQEKIN